MNKMKRYRKKITFAIIILMLLGLMIPVVLAVDDNIIGVYPTTQHVTIEDTFYTDINTTVNWQIDTATIMNITFQPGGVINYTSTAQGNLFSGQLIWYQPDGNNAWDVIDNATGYAKQITWVHTTPVNSTNKTLANITWTAYNVGISYINLTDIGCYNDTVDYGTVAKNAIIYVHPKRPVDCTAIAWNDTQVNLTWDKDVTGADKIVVFANTTAYQTDYLADDIVVNDSSVEHYEHVGISGTWYYTFYGWNETSSMYSYLYNQNESTTLGSFDWAFTSIDPSNTSTTANGDYDIPVNVTITNTYGHNFEWWVNTTNGDNFHNTGETNGTVIGGEMSGLTHDTKYWWNTTVSDGLGHVTSISYWFTTGVGGGTKPNQPTPSPTNGQTEVPISVGSLNVTAVDPDGDDMSVSFYWATNDTLIGTNNNVVSGATTGVAIGELDYGTNYYWYVNVSDGVLYTLGPAAGNWSFLTSNVKISIEKEWFPQANNTILCYINVTNTGSDNLTGVVITETYDTNLDYLYSNPASDGAPNTNWTVPYLNVSGYENYWYNITLWLNLSGGTDGTTYTNTVNISHLSFTTEETVDNDLSLDLEVTKECNRTQVNSDMLTMMWWVNVTNNGNFTLNSLILNETYDTCINYVNSSTVPIGGTDNRDFNLSNSLAPGASVSIVLNLSITGGCKDNGSKVWNNITVYNNESANITLYKNLSYGGFTELIRVVYIADLTDVSILADPIFVMIGVLIIIASLMVIIGMLMKYGYIGRGEK